MIQYQYIREYIKTHNQYTLKSRILVLIYYFFGVLYPKLINCYHFLLFFSISVAIFWGISYNICDILNLEHRAQVL